ncbi:DUF3108 domain-containing protein [Massilia endophytica]|uniref:DUF3108 domain-containing protein n=1 Tax=Massilia endophytica TaxID=2899220 RepID=UPI001E56AF80|nr:DUF3108 domain-containing protein [Massilia endophytica]UGQ46868.1 DUF3108 domain-containing protein [Massilia endophytica]
MTLTKTAVLAVLCLGTAAMAADRHPFSLPPSADLSYSVKASTHGLPLSGTGTVSWRQGDGKYSLLTEARSGLFGKVLEHRSEGSIDEYGLAPATYFEKRIRKSATTTTFRRDAGVVEFSGGDKEVPLKGGEQDRSSAPWQLAAMARKSPEKFKPGSEWSFMVAGRRDAEPWVFKVVGTETLETGMGEVKALHFSKAPPKNNKGQQVDLWLAPSLDWYPVRILFMEEDGDSFDQQLEKVAKK